MRNLKLTFIVALVFVASLSFGQQMRMVTPLSQEDKKELLDKIKTEIKANYVMQDAVAGINKSLDQYRKSQEFKSISNNAEFALKLGKFLEETANDPHFRISDNPVMFSMLTGSENDTNGTLVRRVVGAPESGGDQAGLQLTPVRKVVRQSGGGGSHSSQGTPVRRVVGAQPGSGPQPMSMMRPAEGLDGSNENYFMTELKVLDGNVGYFKIERMPSLESARETVDAAFNFLKNVDALIFDLRGNGGGIGGFIPYVMSYLFKEKGMLLYTRTDGSGNINEIRTSKETGGQLADVPVYVLADRFTGSAATNMAFTLQQFGRAKIVGEESGVGTNGANSSRPTPLANNLILNVPFATVKHAKTGTNWNMVGLKPDIATTSSESLQEAHLIALQDLNKPNVVSKIQDDKKYKKLDFDVNKILGEYEGNRVVRLNGNQIELQRGNNLALPLMYIGDKKFEIKLPPNAYTPVPFSPVGFVFQGDKVIEMRYLNTDSPVEIMKKIK